MSVTPGTHIGPYEVKSPLGEGGMGVVFRARDTKLQRDVALKLLPDHFASDPDRLSRFRREAQLLASVNHPNIAQIYGLEQTGGSGCIVMELVEGETLAQKLKRGALPVDEALQIAKQVADALGAAHERGIVHRDLKPANIKLTPDGKVKVLDFGLAKALGGKAPKTDLSNSPTVVSGSMPGIVFGTAAYMSPEQAKGKEVDARTDIWAFGCILYEMLTGRQAFDGETATDIIAKIVAGQPNLDLLPRDTPSSLRLLLTAAFNKEAPQRLQHIGDMRLFLDEKIFPVTASKSATPTGRRLWLITAALVLALAAALIPAALYFRRAPVETSQIRFEMPAPGMVAGLGMAGLGNLTISPDGQRVAYVAMIEGKRAVWIRPISAVTAQQLPGTENAAGLFWSPDSRYLAFFADGKLKKIDASGGPAQTLCDAILTVPGTWSRDGAVLFTKAGPFVIGRVSASGGEATPVTVVDASRQDLGNVAPQFLPDSRHFLYHGLSAAGELTLYLGSLDSKSTTELMAMGTASTGSPAIYVAPGYLLFRRNRTLMAQAFDKKRLALLGEAIPLAENVEIGFSASENGVLVYRKAGQSDQAGGSQLVWFDRNGKQAGQVGTAANYGNLELSPDDRRVAVDIQGPNRDIWMIDIARAVSARITFDPAADWPPVWAPDGSHIVFSSNRSDNGVTSALSNKLYQKSSSGVGTDELLFAGNPNELVYPEDWSSDGRYILFARVKLPGATADDLWVLPLFGDKKPFPFLQSSFWQVESQLSPDGRWLAFTTNESGTYQIVVQPFPDPSGGKWQVTAKDGIEPKWRRDGRELYYLSLDGKLMAVPVKGDHTFEAGQPSPLFQSPLNVTPPRPVVHHYDVTADGQRFLFISPVTPAPSETNSVPITAVVNWTAGLNKK